MLLPKSTFEHISEDGGASPCDQSAEILSRWTQLSGAQTGSSRQSLLQRQLNRLSLPLPELRINTASDYTLEA